MPADFIGGFGSSMYVPTPTSQVAQKNWHLDQQAAVPVAAPQPAAESLNGFGLPPDIVNDMVARGNESINKAQDSALQNAHARAAASGFSVSGDVNKAEDQLLSDYAGQRAGNERDTRIAAAEMALKDKMSQQAAAPRGFGSTGPSAPKPPGGGGGGFDSSLLPRIVGGGAGPAYLENTAALNEGRAQQKKNNNQVSGAW